jgi:glycosyltransferase involved in cell wall biosynthesis
MPTVITVDAAGGQVGGAARFRSELARYLARVGRQDVHVIGTARQVSPAWLIRREIALPAGGRRVALNNVSFVASGSQRWTLLRNPLDFLTDREKNDLDPVVRMATRRRAPVVHATARRADVLVVPSSAMAERVTRVLPSVRNRIVVRHHPVSADSVPRMERGPSILCPVLFSPYKAMTERLTELLRAMDKVADASVSLIITARESDVPASLAGNPRIKLVGELHHSELRRLWACSRVIYFPPGIESFGYPLAEARVSGHPVIARDTAQNHEIAGEALCGFTVGSMTSLIDATRRAFEKVIVADPAPFDPTAYFDWLLGSRP